MQISSHLHMPPAHLAATQGLNTSPQSAEQTEAKQQQREAFCDAFGQTLFSQVLSAMRKSLHKPAYLHGGRAEEAFQAQLDQVFAEKMSDAVVDSFTGPMFDQFDQRI